MPETNNANSRTEDLVATYASMGIFAQMRMNPMTYTETITPSSTVTLSRSTGSELDTATSASDTADAVSHILDELEEIDARVARRQYESKLDHAFTID